jgi:cytochrome c-type biogenesis protein CcmF
MEVLGRGALLLALLAAAYAPVAAIVGARLHDQRLITSARRALAACFVCVAVASGVLVTAIVRHDFRFQSVAEHSSREVPQPYLISSFWSSQEGSLLLWLLVLSGLSALVTYQHRRRSRELMPYLVAFLGGACAFFAFATSFVASPFATVAQVPRDGAGLVPSLQNPYMLTHPPLLYLGYVGFTIPFAFAMAALVSGRTDGRWLQAVRRWTLVPWLALGVGMLLGAKWAYEEIGWGGFWGWDPVENAALIPWLTATAFLHSVIVQEKKGMLKVWNVALVALTYVLCIVGTFLTRSGFTSSIHTFVVSSVGWWFVGYIAIVATVAIVVITRNLDQLRSPHRIDSLVSREATFLFNNLLFVALAFAILWGVLFPSISEALSGHRVATQSPYYDFFAVVLGLPLLLLAGIGPVIAWRRASARGVVQAFRWPFASALAAGALLVLLGFASSVAGVVALSLCLFVAVTIGLELARGAAARRALASGTSWPAALTQLIGRNRRRYGGYVVHLAVMIGVVAIVGTSAYATSRTLVLAPGQMVQFHGYGLKLRGIESPITRAYISTEAVVDVYQGGHRVDTLRPSARTYLDSGEPTKQIAIRPLLRTGEDLYLVFDGSPRPGVVTLKAFVNPLVNLLWLSAIVLVLGFAIAIWPDPRLAARLARRTNEAFARAR